MPLMQDLVTSQRDKQIIELVSLATVIGYTHWVAPETAAAQVDILRKAYAETLADPALLEEAGKMQMLIRFKSGEELQELVNRVSSTPEPVLEATAKNAGMAEIDEPVQT